MEGGLGMIKISNGSISDKVSTGLVRVELEDGEYFYAQKGVEREGELVFPASISPDRTIIVSVGKKIKKVEDVSIADILLALNWLAASRPKVDPRLIENFLTALPLKKKA
jgi:hypothetical protein